MRNYPNPVHTETTFYYTLEESAQVSIRIINLNGQELETIESGFQQKGEHIIRWANGKLSAGIYLYQLRVGEKLETRKLMLLQ